MNRASIMRWRFGAALAAAAIGAMAHAEGMPAARTVAVPGADLLVRDTGGTGVPVVLLHANTGTSESWRDQYDAFSRAGFRVVAFDRRGWGGSVARPDATGPSSIAGDLDALADALHLAPFHLVGVAGGGFAALDYVAWHPERVRSAVVAASSGLISDPPFVDFAKRIDIPALTAGPASDLELSASYRGGDPAGTAAWAAIEARSRRPGAPSQPLHTPNTVAKLEGIATPLLAVVADADLLAPPAFVRMWADHVRGRALAVVEGAGHAVAWEQPDVFDRLVLDFIGHH